MQARHSSTTLFTPGIWPGGTANSRRCLKRAPCSESLSLSTEVTIAVLADRCAHRLAPLSHCRCEGRQLHCLCQRVLFNPDGAARKCQVIRWCRRQCACAHYPTVEHHNAVWVWMGPAE